MKAKIPKARLLMAILSRDYTLLDLLRGQIADHEQKLQGRTSISIRAYQHPAAASALVGAAASDGIASLVLGLK